MARAHRASVRLHNSTTYVVGTVIGASTFDDPDFNHILIMTTENAHVFRKGQEAFVIMDGNLGARMTITGVYNGVSCSTIRLER